MIDYLISDPKKIGLTWSCILTVMNFIIFRNISEFIWIYFELKIF